MKSNRVTVVDYAIGNLLSVVRALEHVGAKVEVTENPAEVLRAERLVVPGVGAFSDGMAELQKRSLIEPIKEHITKDRPFLGICVGMQIMLDYGQEFGRHEGLAVIPGSVEKIPETGADNQAMKIPHIGWNQLIRPQYQDWSDSIFAGLTPESFVYFLHSYAAKPSRLENDFAHVNYGGRFLTAAVRRGNAYGCQFHLEKSGLAGLNILKRFVT